MLNKHAKENLKIFLSNNSNYDFDLLITADTIVEFNGIILEKPLSEEELYDWFS